MASTGASAQSRALRNEQRSGASNASDGDRNRHKQTKKAHLLRLLGPTLSYEAPSLAPATARGRRRQLMQTSQCVAPTSTARTLQRSPAHAGCIVVGAPQGPGAYDAYRADIGSIQSAPAVSFARSRREAEGRKRFLSKHHKAEPGPDFSPGPGKNTSSHGQSQHCSLALRNNTPSLPQANTTQSLT